MAAFNFVPENEAVAILDFSWLYEPLANTAKRAFAIGEALALSSVHLSVPRSDWSKSNRIPLGCCRGVAIATRGSCQHPHSGNRMMGPESLPKVRACGARSIFHTLLRVSCCHFGSWVGMWLCPFCSCTGLISAWSTAVNDGAEKGTQPHSDPQLHAA